MYDIVGKRNLWFAISAILTIPGLLFIFLGGLKPSIDFTGGTEWEVRYADQPVGRRDDGDAGGARLSRCARDRAERRVPPDPHGADRPRPGADARAVTVGLGLRLRVGSASPSAQRICSAEPSPSRIGDRRRASPSAEPTPPPIAEGTEFAELETELEDRFGTGDPRLVRTVGPIIGAELIRTSAILIVVGELFILAYLWMRFGFRFGTAAIIALLHDVILVVGTFAVLGYFFNLEFDALFVTALLTIIGFSVHDTIVVFDRIRENRVRHAGESFGAIVNHSILQTVARSIITSLTVVVTLGALLLLGPPTIQTFTLALLLGVVSGTYSSIFNASQILVAWDEWDRNRKARQGTARPARSGAR